MNLKRIFILGNMGSGKSTLAKKISKKLNISHYDLDDIFWSRKFNKKRNYKLRDKKFRELCDKLQRQNYNKKIDISNLKQSK